MKIESVQYWREHVPLTRPYAIAGFETSEVELLFVCVRAEGGALGVGSASPAEDITGERPEDSEAFLVEHASALLAGQELSERAALCASLAGLAPAAPAGRAALDMALWDLEARARELPLVELLGGRQCGALPTSITLGIREEEECLEEAREYLERGFRSLKVKLGRDIDGDLARLERLRELAGAEVGLRVDANQGYDVAATLRLFEAAGRLDLELLEQPLPVEADEALLALPPELRELVALDESLQGEADAERLLAGERLCGSFVVKLMKCGGVTPALAIARRAEAAGVQLMWGCMDESVVSIAAALHAAYASPGTRYLDLDGSFDLSRDPATGGFELKDGALELLDRPGLGVELQLP